MLITSRRGSPTPSLSSSAQQGGLGAMATSQLTAAATHRKQEPGGVGLTPTLANYVNPKLMDHVTGWIVDPAEIQVMYC